MDGKKKLEELVVRLDDGRRSCILTAREIRSISDAFKAMEAENERLREALTEFMEITEPASVPAFRDPVHGDDVEALGRRIGFGALISSASASWRDVAKECGDPPGGEFVVGPCYSVLVSVRKRAAAILKGSRHV